MKVKNKEGRGKRRQIETERREIKERREERRKHEHWGALRDRMKPCASCCYLSANLKRRKVTWRPHLHSDFCFYGMSHSSVY